MVGCERGNDILEGLEMSFVSCGWLEYMKCNVRHMTELYNPNPNPNLGTELGRYFGVIAIS
jgi:hypothetical protein